MKVLLLAAGLGTRLRPLTFTTPKPCVPFLNVPLGLYNFRFLKHLDISQLVVNTHHLPEQVEQLYRTQNYYNKPIQFSYEQGAILGSGGGLKKASRLFYWNPDEEQSVLLVNSDEILFDVDEKFLKNAYEYHCLSGNDATLVTMRHPEAGKKFGAIWTSLGEIRHIGKTTEDKELKPEHYIGMMFLKASLIEKIPTSEADVNIFYNFLIQHLPELKVRTYQIACRWYETGNFEDYFAATTDALQKLSAQDLVFICQNDDSSIIKNQDVIALISKTSEIKLEKSQIRLSGTVCVSKSTHEEILITNKKSIENSILFQKYTLNKDFFKTTDRP